MTKSKKKILSVVLVITIIIGIVGCGSSDAETASVEEAETIEVKTDDVETATVNGKDTEIPVETVKADDAYTYEEYTDIFTIEEIDMGDGRQVDFDAMEDFVEPYILTDSIDVYSYFGTYAGYTKPDIEVMTSGRDDEWVVVAFAEYSYLVKAEDFEKNAVPMQREIENTLESPQEGVVSEKIEPAPAANGSVASGGTNGTLVEQGQVTVEENTKYTPEEAVAVYRSIMEAGGMKWNPSLKGNWNDTIGQYPIEEWNLHSDNYFGGNWGTGWIYLEKGMPEESAESNLASAKMGDTVGNPYTDFYFEVTGSDKNAVYITEWVN